MTSSDKINKIDLDIDNLELLSLLQNPKYTDTYIKLAEHRCLFLSEVFTKKVSAEMSAWLLHYNQEDPSAPIYLYINSVGGDGAALTNIYDVMNYITAPITTICMGKCYSAGAFILAAGAKGKRYVYRNSRVMIHGVQCSIPPDDQNNSKTYYEFLDNYNDQLLHILSKHTGQTLSKIKEDCQRDFYLDASESIKYGLADYILT